MRLRLFNSISVQALCLTVLLLALSAAVQAQDAEPTVLLHSIKSSDGSGPSGDLVQGKNGVLYGTTQFDGKFQAGTVFKVKADGTGFTVLHSFTIYDTADGLQPRAGVILGNNGYLYGTTNGGGANNVGTMFKINIDGTGFTLLHSFSGSTTDGASPNGLMQGMDGSLYGTTVGGGANGQGTVFKINADGTGFTLLYSFDSTATDGFGPIAGLVQDTNGVLYGTTAYGGEFSSNVKPAGWGTVFTINTDGSGYALLHSFNGSDGEETCSVIQGEDGSLYGTTHLGGAKKEGTVFKVNTDGTGFTLLHSFSGSTTDGAEPDAGLIQGKDGSLYGTTHLGGAKKEGTVFKVNTDGTGFTLLHGFSGSATDGAGPDASLIQGEDGNLYGTTYNGGLNNAGTIFRIGPAATSFSPKVLATNVDTRITLTGSGFASNETVYWNSNALTTTYLSSTQLQAIVPEYLLSPTGKDFLTVWDPNINNNSNILATHIGVPQLKMSVPTQVHQNRDGSVTVKLTLDNLGTAPAYDVTLTTVYLGSTPASSGTGSVGTIRNGSSLHVLLTFPASVPLGSETFAVAGSYTPVGFSGSFTIQVLAH